MIRRLPKKNRRGRIAALSRRLSAEPLEERTLMDAGGTRQTAQFLVNEAAGSLTESLSSHGDLDYFAFYAKAGTTITASAWPTNHASAPRDKQLDPIVGIFNPAGVRVATDDDSGETDNNPWKAVATYDVTVDGIWYVAVTDYDDFSFSGAPGEGPGASIGSYKLVIDGISPLELNAIFATYDSDEATKNLGKYLPGASLTNEIRVEMGFQLPADFVLMYRFGNGGERPADRSGTKFTFEQDMGKLDPNNAKLKLRLIPGKGAELKGEAEVKFYDTLPGKITATINDQDVPIEDLRLIAGVNADVPIKIELGNIDFLQNYSLTGLSIGNIGTSGAWSTGITGRYATGFLAKLPTSFADRSEGDDYQIALLGTIKNAVAITSSKGIKVVPVPDWIKKIGYEPPKYSGGSYEIVLKENLYHKEIDPFENLDLGLLKPAASSIDLKAKLKVQASIIENASVAPKATLQSASGELSLLGSKTTLFSTGNSQVEAEAVLDNEKLTLGAGVTFKTTSGITIEEEFLPKFDTKLQLPSALLDASKSGGVTLNAGLMARIDPGAVILNFSITIGSDLAIGPGSYVQVDTSAEGHLVGTASATLFGIDDEHYLLRATATGGVSAAVAIRAKFDVSGKLSDLKVNLNRSDSGAVLGYRPFLKLTGSAISEKFAKAEITYPADPNAPATYLPLWNNGGSVANPTVPPPPTEPASPGAPSASSFAYAVATSWEELGSQSVVFGSATGSYETVRFEVTNTGGSNVQIRRASIVGAGFELLSPINGGRIVAPGETTSFDIRLQNASLPAHALLRIEEVGSDTPIDIPLDYDPSDPVDLLPPEIESIELRHSGWAAQTPSADAGDILPQPNLDQVVVTFTEDVDVSAGDLYLRGASVGTIGFAGFHYANRVATWTLAAPLSRDRYAIDLAASIRDRVDRTLLAQATTRFTVLPGDADGSGDIGFSDFVLVSNAFGQPAAGNEISDLNGDGQITFADFVIVSNSFGKDQSDLGLPALFPQWNVGPDQQVAPGESLQMQFTATDENPGDQLTYLLVDPPTGATLDPVTGAFHYTPPEWMVYDDVRVTIAVQDDSAAQLRNVQSFVIHVRPLNEPPALAGAPSAEQVAQGDTWFFLVEADDPNWPLETLTYSLVSAPAGAEIDSETGLLTWTPGYGELLGVRTCVVRVTDMAGEFAQVSIDVEVLEVNRAPALAEVPPQELTEFEQLDLYLVASDENTWNTLTYRLGDDVPAGVTIDANTGRLRWVPGETDDGLQVFTVIVSDNGAGTLEAEQQIVVNVLESDATVALYPLEDQQVAAGELLLFTAVAFDADNPEGIVFSLEGAPEGATIDPEFGTFAWLPGMGDVGTYTFIVRATSGDLSDFQTIMVDVRHEAQPPELGVSLDEEVNSNGYTDDATLMLFVSDESQLAAVYVVFNFMAPGESYDLLPLLDEYGVLVLDEDVYEQLYGGTLPDGEYTATFTAVDEWGNTSTRVIEFKLDDTAPNLTAALDPESDRGVLGDGRTSEQWVVIRGQTDPGVEVSIGDVQAEVDAEGYFSITVELATGTNYISVQAREAAGNYEYVDLEILRYVETTADTFGYEATAVAPEFIDVSTTGTRLLAGTDSSYAGIYSYNLNGFEFDFYGQRYNRLYVQSNGIITFDGIVTSAPQYAWPLSERNTAAAIAPFWQDLIVSGASDSGVYYEVRSANGSQQLIIQWHHVRIFGETNLITFQAVLDSADGSIQFNYLDLETGTANSEGANALVGIKQAGLQHLQGQFISAAGFSGPNAFVGTGKSTRFAGAVPDVVSPVLTAALNYHGSGRPELTNNTSMSLTVFDFSAIVTLEAWLDDAPVAVSILDRLVSGRISLDEIDVEALAGGPLADGPHTFHVRAVDEHGNERVRELNFTLDRIPPVITAELAPEFDTGVVGDLRTTLETVGLILHGEPGSEVYFQGHWITLDEAGAGVVSNVALPQLGTNRFSGSAYDAAGNYASYEVAIMRVTESGTLGPDAFGYQASIVTPEFIDIASTGTQILVGAYDSYQALDATALQGFEFTFYGRTYSELFVSTNGMVTFGSGYGWYPSYPMALLETPDLATIAVLGARLDVATDPESGVFYEVIDVPGGQRVVVQWNKVRYSYSTDPITFQVVLDTTDNSIQFNYLDLDSDVGAYHQGGAYTVAGIKSVGNQTVAGAALIIDSHSAPNEFVATGQSTRINLVAPDEQPPILNVRLVEDTYISSDNLTSNPLIQLTSIDASGIALLRVGFGDRPLADYVDLTALLVDGELTFTEETLEQVLGATLLDGTYTLRLYALDGSGNSRAEALTFTLDRTLPPLTLNLDPASDTGIVGDNRTYRTTVKLVGQTEPGASVWFNGLGGRTADASGRFEYQGISLEWLGQNYYYGSVTDRAGNSNSVLAQFELDTATGTFGPDTFGYQAKVVAPAFQDISQLGTRLLRGVDEGSVKLSTNELAGFTFPFYSVAYDSLFVHANGAITFEPADMYWIRSSDALRYVAPTLIAPLWEDLLIPDSPESGVYYWLDGVAGARTLILQWNNVQYSGHADLITFQVLLEEATGAIQFNYLNLFSTAADRSEGAYASAGIKHTGYQYALGARLAIDFMSGPTQFVGTGLSTRIEVQSPDTLPPLLSMELSDSNYRTPVLSGMLIDASAITSFEASFNASFAGAQSVLAALQPNGTFRLEMGDLDAIFGGLLPDGNYTLYVRAQDTQGRTSAVRNVQFGVDRTPPATPTLGISPEFDTGVVGDLGTMHPRTSVEGYTDPYAYVEMKYVGADYISRTTYADSNGWYRLDDVQPFPIQVTAKDSWGNTSSAIFALEWEGLGPDAYGHYAWAHEHAFDFNVVNYGTRLTESVYDGYVHLTQNELPGMTFSFFGVEYQDIYIGMNGIISFEQGIAGPPTGSDSLQLLPMPAIAVFWDDLRGANSSASGLYYDYYEDTIGSGDNGFLTIGWHDVWYSHILGYVTIQAHISRTRISFEYINLDIPEEAITHAIVGITAGGDQSETGNILLISQGSAHNLFVGTDQSISISTLPGRFSPHDATPLHAISSPTETENEPTIAALSLALIEDDAEEEWRLATACASLAIARHDRESTRLDEPALPQPIVASEPVARLKTSVSRRHVDAALSAWQPGREWLADESPE